MLTFLNVVKFCGNKILGDTVLFTLPIVRNKFIIYFNTARRKLPFKIKLYRRYCMIMGLATWLMVQDKCQQLNHEYLS